MREGRRARSGKVNEPETVSLWEARLVAGERQGKWRCEGGEDGEGEATGEGRAGKRG